MAIAVIGAGPAGLSAAYELGKNHLAALVLEQDPEFVGGISRTVNYKGYRFDIGGHRFYSKSQQIEDFWTQQLGEQLLTRRRISRIYYDNKFYDYPLKLGNAFRNMGLLNTTLCVADYLKAKLNPPQSIATFEDWVVNNFGRRLFEIFFQTYTEKVWGTKCNEISADWAAQRIKGLNLVSVITHAFLPQKGTARPDTVKTLIEEFRYPSMGPGMLWEQVAQNAAALGTDVVMGSTVIGLVHNGTRIISVNALDMSGAVQSYAVDHVISTMPIRSLVKAFTPSLPQLVTEAAQRLKYRDFITVALIVDTPNLFPDQWIYIHDPGVKVGRIQNFGNWSPAMLPNNTTSCLGLEYFCFEGDGLWTASNEDLIQLGIRELEQLKLLAGAHVIDGQVVRVPKAYPVYDGDYQENVDTIVRSLQSVATNLQLAGRNGMHRYNNQDHAMMTGYLAARNILGEHHDLWAVNGDAQYLEEVRSDRWVPKVVAKA